MHPKKTVLSGSKYLDVSAFTETNDDLEIKSAASKNYKSNVK
jgi:hypothetical protein